MKELAVYLEDVLHMCVEDKSVRLLTPELRVGTVRVLVGREDAAALTTDRERLEAVRVELDRAWDLLRQRRGLREAGVDPGDAGPRAAGTVEGYIQ